MMKIFTKVVPVALLVLPLSVGAASLYGDTSVQVTADTGTSVSAGADVNAQGSAGTGSTDTGTVVNVNVDTAGNQMQASGDATMSAEFKLFADGVKAKNERVEAVTVNGDGDVDVAYRHNGRLFG
ncbi:MAG: hypothetical protein V4437_02715, partial [Patescibacteria group bacterium]